MAQTVIHMRKDGRTQRLVGPSAKQVAKGKVADGWEQYEPGEPFVQERPQPAQPAAATDGESASESPAEPPAETPAETNDQPASPSDEPAAEKSAKPRRKSA